MKQRGFFKKKKRTIIICKLRLEKCYKSADNFKFFLFCIDRQWKEASSTKVHTGVQEVQGTTVPLSVNSILLTHSFPCNVHHEDNLVQVSFPLICFDCLSGDCSDYFWLKPDQEKFLFLRLCIYKTTNYWNIFSKKVISVIH